jgi:hypothetical protein
MPLTAHYAAEMIRSYSRLGIPPSPLQRVALLVQLCLGSAGVVGGGTGAAFC